LPTWRRRRRACWSRPPSSTSLAAYAGGGGASSDAGRGVYATAWSERRLRGDAVENLIDRGDELLNALALERGDDVVVVDADGVELVEQVLRLVEIRLEPKLDPTVVLEGANRLLGHGGDRVRPNQLLDVERVAKARILHRRRRPEATLRGRAARGEIVPTLAVEQRLVLLVGELRVGDAERRWRRRKAGKRPQHP
jgi:hypothetical protein